MTVIPLVAVGKELVADDAKESSPSKDTTARPFKLFVKSVGRFAAVACDKLPLNASPVALSDQLATAAPLPRPARSCAFNRTSGVTASGIICDGVEYRIESAS